ncbi:hypothetical protein C10C_0087 [Chlamydia serpentis]|uniref:Macro domain-containing protein n=1 Tax=Chlamydia serpentis TaxID=1967782 RepID=A0A2R8FA46_9CHLA|nr:hypothetical protein [Chlamydia serpentis]SPN73274.1 hypothetical protein C10C_0087 [Chlamydia serpentis]
MSITNQKIFILNHYHDRQGYNSGKLKNIPLINPLNRSYLERIASWIPILSTFTGIRILKGINSFQTSMVTITNNFLPTCKTFPCPEIHHELPQMKKMAWLEIFGIKALYYLVLGIIKIVRLFIRCTCCNPPKELQTPLSPEPIILDVGKQIDSVFPTDSSPKPTVVLPKPQKISPIPKSPFISERAISPGNINSSPTLNKKPPPSPIPLTYPQYNRELINNWTPLEEPFPWPPTQKNQRSFGWQLNNSKLIFISTTGSIEQPCFATNSASFMIVNAANAKMTRGGLKGTNKILSQTVSAASWNSSQIPANPGRKGMPLEISECRVGQWSNADGSTHTGQKGKPHYLAQLLGPKARDYNNNCKKAFSLCKKAYLNCFKLALQLNVTYLQLPLISSEHFAPLQNKQDPHNPMNNVYKEWMDTVKLALVAAMQEFGKEYENQTQKRVIVLVNTGLPDIMPAQENN